MPTTKKQLTCLLAAYLIGCGTGLLRDLAYQSYEDYQSSLWSKPIP